MHEIQQLRQELERQRTEYQNNIWDINSRSMHFRLDELTGNLKRSSKDFDVLKNIKRSDYD